MLPLPVLGGWALSISAIWSAAPPCPPTLAAARRAQGDGVGCSGETWISASPASTVTQSAALAAGGGYGGAHPPAHAHVFLASDCPNHCGARRNSSTVALDSHCDGFQYHSLLKPKKTQDFESKIFRQCSLLEA